MKPKPADEQVVRKTVSFYPEQAEYLISKANEEHRGNVSRVIQEIIEEAMAKEEGMQVASEKGAYNPKPKAVDARTASPKKKSGRRAS
jgi:hypothetical protein